MDAPIDKEAQSTDTFESEYPNRCIRCPECGEEIQMVPTLADMIAAIENHIGVHREQAKTDLGAAHIKVPCIRGNLTEQVIIKAAQLRETIKDSALIRLE